MPIASLVLLRLGHGLAQHSSHNRSSRRSIRDCDLAAAFTETVDQRLQAARRRSDLGEMAQLAAVETLTGVLGQRLADLFGTTPAEVRQTAHTLSTSRGFGSLPTSFSYTSASAS